jgi:hypothetical protein
LQHIDKIDVIIMGNLPRSLAKIGGYPVKVAIKRNKILRQWKQLCQFVVISRVDMSI